MNTETGQIYTGQQEIEEAILRGEPLKEMKVAPTPQQMRRNPPKVGRNEPCPCGSGKKFKKCCYTGG